MLARKANRKSQRLCLFVKMAEKHGGTLHLKRYLNVFRLNTVIAYYDPIFRVTTGYLETLYIILPGVRDCKDKDLQKML